MWRSTRAPSWRPRRPDPSPVHFACGPLLLPLSAVICAVLLLGLVAAGLCPLSAGAAGAPATVKVTPAAFSPNGDKIKERVTIRVKLKKKAKLTVAVYGPDGKLVKTLQKAKTVRAGTRTYRWNGREAGKPLGNARYQVRVKVKIGKRTKTVRRRLTLDTVGPQVTVATPLPNRVFGGAASSFSYTVSGGKPARVELQVRGADAGPRGRLLAVARAARPAAKGRLTWSGQGKTGAFLKNGAYAVSVRAVDAAGNATVSLPAPISVYAPRKIVGVVRSAAGKPLSGADVKVTGTRLKTRSRADGSFRFAACPMGFRTFTAVKKGAGSTRARVKVNMTTGTVGLTLGGKSAGRAEPGGAESPAKAPRDTEVTISGHMRYQDKNGVACPMRNVHVVLQDEDSFTYSDMKSGKTDQNGYFSFTYDYDGSWDWFNEPDVRVVAYARDGDRNICAVYHDYWDVTPHTLASQAYEDNTSDRTGLVVTKVDATDRAAWRILEEIQDARNRWRNLTNWSRGLVKVEYPADLDGANGKYHAQLDWIDVDDAAVAWNGTTARHEYGHAIMAAAYRTSDDNSIYCAYLDSTRLSNVYVFPPRNRWYTYKHDCQDLAGLEEEQQHSWPALNEGWARFFAAFMLGCDWDGYATDETLERDYDHPGKDDNRIIRSASRILWDLADDRSTPLAASWNRGPEELPPVVARPNGLFGNGDDDRLSFSGSPPSGNVVSKLWTVMRNDWPASISELRRYLRERYTSMQLNWRGLDAIFYRMGVDKDLIHASEPRIDDSISVAGQTNTDGSLRGTLNLWCAATDATGYLGGDPDQGRLKVRWEARRRASYGLTAWQPLTWTTQRSATDPAGRPTGDWYWYKATYDTRGLSPVELIPNPHSLGFTNRYFERDIIKTDGRLDEVWVRAIPFDGFAEGPAREYGPFAIDNNPFTGVTGTVKSATTSLPIQGATVELRKDADSPQGELWGTTTSNSYGTYLFTGMPAGGYTVVAGMTGYTSNHVSTTISSGIVTGNCDVALTPLAPPGFGSFATNVAGGNAIWWGPWPTSESIPHDATYELRFGSAGIEEGTIAMIPVAYSGATAPIMRLMLLSDGKLRFAINEAGNGIYGGTWHTITSDRRMVYDRIYHVACQHGSQGMQLFVDGQLWASSAYTGWPQQNVVVGSTTSGFSIGDYERVNGPAKGLYDEVRVSHVQRYSGTFTPPATPFTADAQTDILDHLDGSTHGVNDGFTFVSYSGGS